MAAYDGGAPDENASVRDEGDVDEGDLEKESKRRQYVDDVVSSEPRDCFLRAPHNGKFHEVVEGDSFLEVVEDDDF
ncbi:hypothetical protein BU16DRAFT_557457 [Lophium mytilinum]|uniref:Uncharacterized protein n=1 Tax=Lophium mytilinum TaxID=390894 RepID=A0A6A6R457_9PEZI|nr:hypothetical protein BU16DRAFT_557457 [Lophium mytilinum]